MTTYKKIKRFIGGKSAGYTFKFAATILFLIHAIPANAEIDTLWAKWYEGTIICSVHQLPDGGYIFVHGCYNPQEGTDSDFHLVRTDDVGDTLWTRYYGGDDSNFPYSMKMTSDGGYIIAGSTLIRPQLRDDVFVVKTDSLGDSIWTLTYDGGHNDLALDVIESSSGGYTLAGASDSFGSGGLDVDCLLIYTDNNGDTLGTRIYGGDNWDESRSIELADDGGYVLAGSGGDGFYYDLFKVDALGQIVWGLATAGAFYSLDKTIDGGFIAAGEKSAGGYYQAFLQKVNSEGGIQWGRSYGHSPDWTIARCVRQCPDGGYIVAGCTGNGYYPDIYVFKTDSLGNMEWERSYNFSGGGGAQAYSVAPTADGAYIVGAAGGGSWLFKIGETTSVSIGMTPYNPPIQVSPGGTFTYTGALTNKLWVGNSTDVWVMVDVPGFGLYGPVLQANNIHLDPNESITYPGIIQHVPLYAPFGVYNYIAYCGEYPSVKIDSASFSFTVLLETSVSGESNGWTADGGWGSDPGMPIGSIFLETYPNPTNAVAKIIYGVAEPREVILSIYNILGQRMYEQTAMHQKPGTYSTSWDGSRYPSGIYLVRVKMGNLEETKRLLILK